MEMKTALELKSAEEQMDSIFNTIPGGIAIYRLTDKFETVYFSDGVPELSGYTVEEYRKRMKEDAMLLVYGKDREKVHSEVMYALEHDTAVDVSFRKNHIAGNLVWVHMYAKKIGEDDGHPLIQAIFHNVSKDAQMYKEILDETDVAVYLCDKETYELLYVNDAAFRMVGKPASGYTGQTCHKFMMDSSEKCEFCQAHLFKKECLTESELYIPRQKQYYKVKGRVIEWQGREAFVQYCDNITGEKQQQAELEAMKNQLQAVMSNINGGVAFTHVNPAGEVKPVYVSEGFYKLLACETPQDAEIYLHHADARIHPMDLEAFPKFSTVLEQQETELSFTYRVMDARGIYVWMNNKTSVSRTDDGGYDCYTVVMDVTREKEAEQELELSKKRLHYALEQTNINVWEYDIKNHCASQSVHSGKYTNDRDYYENYPQCLFEEGYFYGESEEKAREMFRRVEAGEPYVSEELMIRDCRDGTYWWERNTCHEIKDENGNPARAIIIGVDITKQKNMEERFRQETNYSRELNDENIVSAMLINVSEGRIEKWIKRTKYTVEREGLSSYMAHVRDIADTVTEEYKKAFLQAFDIDGLRQEAAAGHEKTELIYGRDYMGGLCYLHTVIRLSRHPSTGQWMGTLVTRDITSEFLYKKMVDSVISNNYMYIARVDGRRNSYELYERGKMPVKSRRFEAERAQFVRETFREDDPEKDMLLKLTNIGELCAYLDEHGEYNGTHRIDGTDGEIRVCQERMLYIEPKSRQICILCSDITEALTEEEEKRGVLKEALELANQANAAKSTFLSSMSHDIRTPMNAIVGMTRFAIDDIGNPAKVRESLEIIDESSQQLLGLINNILDVSRIESGHMELAADECRHSAEMEKILKYIQPLADKKHQKLEWDCSKIIHDRCIMDKTRQHQILQNLLSNAIKFTPENGTISLSLSELPPGAAGIATYRYCVRDTGKGMSEETVAHLFEPFYRENSSSVRRIEGSGLGLSIVKSLVDAQGGTIRVSSGPGKGSVFTVELPMRVVEEEEGHPENFMAAKRTLPPVDFRGVRVLLVEDHPINTIIAQKLLEKAGVSVTAAENGAEGYKKFADSGENGYDAILMDIQMPVMDGYEATRKIRASGHPRAKTVPIIAMTANAYAEDKERCLKAGMNAHIAKPVEPEELYDTLQGQLAPEGREKGLRPVREEEPGITG